ncbi:MAG: hypothetical protein Q4A82_03300 [Corynebacterium sp.]|nr:hypothetical protein [Corynebacterium sp.]
MKQKTIALLRFALVIAFCIITIPHFLTTAYAAQSNVNEEAITNAIKTYQGVLDSQWSNVSCKTSRCLSSSSRIVGTPKDRGTFTEVERVNLKTRDELLADGTWLSLGKSEVKITKITPLPDGTVEVTADIATTLTEGGKDGKNTPGSLNDTHTFILLQTDNKQYVVLKDTVNKTGSSVLSYITIKGQIIIYICALLVLLVALMPWFMIWRDRSKRSIENRFFISLIFMLVTVYLWWLTRHHAHVTGINGARRVCKGSYAFMLNPRVAKIMSWSNECVVNSWIAMTIITAAAIAVIALEVWVVRRYVLAVMPTVQKTPKRPKPAKRTKVKAKAAKTTTLQADNDKTPKPSRHRRATKTPKPHKPKPTQE